MYKKNIVLLLCFIGFTTVSQEKWTLNRCIRYGVDNNLTVQNAAISEDIADISLKQTKWNYLPEIYAGSSAGMNYGRSIDPSTNAVVKTSFFGNSYYLSASLPLFSGFSQLNKMAYQRFLSLSAENKHVKLEDEIAFTVMNAFFDVVYYDELLSIADEQRELSKLNLRKTEILVTTGLKSEADLLEVKANVEKDELFYIQSKNYLEAAQINLRKAMNLGLDTRLELEKPPDSVFVISTDDVNHEMLFQNYAQWSPELNSYENEWKASLKKVGISRSAYYPLASLEASYGTGYYETNKDSSGKTYAFSNQFRNNESKYVGLSLTIPIFTKNQVRLSVREAKLASEQSKNMLDKAKQDLQLEIVENVNSMIAASRELKQAQNQLEADKLAFEAAQKKYDRGMIGVVDFYTAKNRLSTTRGQALRARLTLEIKKRTIDFYKGIRFWEK